MSSLCRLSHSGGIPAHNTPRCLCSNVSRKGCPSIHPVRAQQPARSARRNKCMVVCAASGSSLGGTPAGNVIREILTQEERSKLLTDSDNLFYSQPRFCTHVDGNFLSQLTQLYRDRISEDSVVLDLMSSWVSHLPPERRRKAVIGHGMNEAELKQNGALDDYFLRNLNEEPRGWPVDSDSVDAVVCCVSVQYLQQPEEVFAEMHRVLKPGGVAIVSFSNRLFYEKAIAAWRQNTDFGRQQLVKSYFQVVSGYSDPEVVTEVERPKKEAKGLLEGFRLSVEEWLRAGVCDPFFAVIAYKDP